MRWQVSTTTIKLVCFTRRTELIHKKRKRERERERKKSGKKRFLKHEKKNIEPTKSQRVNDEILQQTPKKSLKWEQKGLRLFFWATSGVETGRAEGGKI
jgi:hypothetical protein